MKKKVVIIDYGSGNIVSAQQSFLKAIYLNNFEGEVIITNDLKEVGDSSHLVLPGQGAFKTCIDGLKKIDGMMGVLEDRVLNQKIPFLGICVGMQLLANKSYENGTHIGLGWIKGNIKKIPLNNIKLPHMGWNNVKLKDNNNCKIFFEQNLDFYFVHSYYFECINDENVVGSTDYGLNFPSIIAKENIYGVQFHPEKSSKQGLNLIKNFLLI